MIGLALILALPTVASALRGGSSSNNGIITRRLSDDISDPSYCYPLLHDASTSNTLTNEDYYTFVDAMSSSYFSSNDISDYNSLPTTIKYSFVTLSCQCQLRGGDEECCLAPNAALDSTGSDPDGPPPSDEQAGYLNDICATTADAIGENVSGGTDDGNTGALPLTTNAPSESPKTSVIEPDGTGETDDDESNVNDNNREIETDGLSGGAWAGIAIAGAAVGTMLLYLVMRNEGDNEDNAVELDNEENDMRKERRASSLNVNTNKDGSGEQDAPISPTSTMDATQSITEAHSDVSSLPSSIGMSKSSEDGNHRFNDMNLLPGMHNQEDCMDDESYFYSQDQNNMGTGKSSLAAMGVASGAIVGMGRVTSNHHNDDESSISSKSASSSVLMEDALPSNNQSNSKSALPPQHYTPGELDQAIENGNWEAVAASAAAIVGQSNNLNISQSMSSDSGRGGLL